MEVLALLNRARLSPPSWSLKGKIYEHLASFALSKRYECAGLEIVSMTGQSGDRGIDIIARWGKISVIAQCKSSYRKPSGILWRDLSGVHQLNKPHKTLMMLVSPAPMTAQAHTEFSNSSSPLMHCLLPVAPLSATQLSELPGIKAAFLNGAARKLLQEEDLFRRYANT